jgi:hypothetical protein
VKRPRAKEFASRGLDSHARATEQALSGKADPLCNIAREPAVGIHSFPKSAVTPKWLPARQHNETNRGPHLFQLVSLSEDARSARPDAK